MQVKQEKNGRIGELRTEDFLLNNFNVLKRIPDIEGADLIVEKEYAELEQHRRAKEKITVYGIVQSKSFQNKNEVIISKEYIEDNEGIITEFFVLIHKIDEDNVYYFFNAQEIKCNWRSSERKKGKYYVFKLSKKNHYEAFKNISKNTIYRKIEEGINKTEEFRNQKLIQNIEARFKNPEKSIFDNSNKKLFSDIKGKHIVDKLYMVLNFYKDFRRITSWRLIDKISFKETHHTSTHYNQFSLYTNNNEILDFFTNISIEKEVTITNPDYFKGVLDVNSKINRIVEILNDNLIFYLINKNESVKICKQRELLSKSPDYLFDILNFHEAHSSLPFEKEDLSDLWECMEHAYIYFKFGEYEIAHDFYKRIAENAKQNKEEIIYFFAQYNIRATSWRNFENTYPDLDIELSKLATGEKKQILESIANEKLFNDCAESIDEIYLKIKDFKQRRDVNDTADLIKRIYSKLAEYINFTDGNWLVINSYEEFNTIVEKVIESCILSFSMKTKHTNHLKELNDILVQLAIHFCEPDKLLSFFQRNDVNTIPYKTSNEYFKNCLVNFFSKKNIDFLYYEICYFDNRTKNPYLRRKIEKIFKNLCILLAYLDIEVNADNLLKKVSYFIEKLDFNIQDLSFLTLPLLQKPNQYSVNNIFHLIKVIISKNNLFKGYLLTNCLYSLKDKGFAFKSSDEDIINSLIAASIEKPRYDMLKVLPKLLSNEKCDDYKNKIQDMLETKFNRELYYEAVVNKCLEYPLMFFDEYLNFFSSIYENKTAPDFFNTASPYTGINEPLRQNLNNLVEIVFVLNDDCLMQKPIIMQIKEYHPYYNFILNIDQFNSSCPFDKLWILENQSEIVLKKLFSNKHLRSILKNELTKQYHKELGRLFIKYFTN